MKRFQPPSEVCVVIQVGLWAHYLPQCLEALLEQSHGPHQIVTIGPPRNELSPSTLPLLRYVCHVPDHGLDSWKVAGAQVRTAYLLPLFAHDWLSSTALEALELALDVRKQTGLVRAKTAVDTTEPRDHAVNEMMTPVILLRRDALRSSASLVEVFEAVRTNEAASLLQPGWSVFTIPHNLAHRRFASETDIRFPLAVKS